MPRKPFKPPFKDIAKPFGMLVLTGSFSVFLVTQFVHGIPRWEQLGQSFLAASGLGFIGYLLGYILSHPSKPPSKKKAEHSSKPVARSIASLSSERSSTTASEEN